MLWNRSVALFYEELERKQRLARERSVALFYEELEKKQRWSVKRGTFHGAIFYEEPGTLLGALL